MKNSFKIKKQTIFKSILTIFFLVITIKKVNIELLIKVIMDYPKTYFVISFLIAILVNFIGAISLRAIYDKENLIDIFKAIMKSNFYSMFLPGQILGETTKILMLSSEKSTIGVRISAVVIDKYLNIIGMLIVGVIGIVISPNINELTIKKWFIIFLFIFIIVAMILKNKTLIAYIMKTLNKFVKKGKIKDKIISFLDIWMSYTNKNNSLLISGICGIVYQIVIATAYYYLGSGMGLKVSLWDFCWINTVLTVVLFFPISIGGLGVREATLIGFLGILGVNAEHAVGISVLMLLITILRAIIGGIIVMGEKSSTSGSETS